MIKEKIEASVAKESNRMSCWFKLALKTSDESTSQKDIVKRSTFLLICSFTVIAGLVWGILYLVLKEEKAAKMPFIYSALNGSSLILFTYRKHYEILVVIQLSLILILPFSVHCALGGLQKSGGVILWSFLAPLGSAFFRSVAESVLWFKAFLIIFLSSMIIEQASNFFTSSSPSVILSCYWTMNILGVTTITFFAAFLFAQQLEQEYVRTEKLLHNILPGNIVKRIKKGDTNIVDNYDDVTILFADLVGFTKAASKLCPSILIGSFLRDVFFEFDKLVKSHKVEKIKTIGDAYMVVSGLEAHDTQHNVVMMSFARDMIAVLEKINEKYKLKFQLRVGIHRGPVVAGVLGFHKFAYDVWGNAVNIASRMESHGIPGCIHISNTLYNHVSHMEEHFEFRCLGESSIKSLGSMKTFIAVPKIKRSEIAPNMGRRNSC